jgi:biotin operon repressor
MAFIPYSFRECILPSSLKTHEDKLIWALERFKKEKPLSTKEIVYELYISRLSSSVHKLRKRGYIIDVVDNQKGDGAYYQLIAKPGEELKLNL